MTSARAREELRQEREAFDQAKAHDARWFTLRLTMGYVGVVLLLAMALVAGHVLLHPESYSAATIAIAAGILLVDMLSLVVSIVKLVLRNNCPVPLKPATKCRRKQVPTVRNSEARRSLRQAELADSPRLGRPRST